MSDDQVITRFEGSQVSVALRNGERLDDCQLVAGPRGGTRTLWLFNAGVDVFIPLADVIALWETNRPSVAA